jgi:hypothetical protein
MSNVCQMHFLPQFLAFSTLGRKKDDNDRNERKSLPKNLQLKPISIFDLFGRLCTCVCESFFLVFSYTCVLVVLHSLSIFSLSIFLNSLNIFICSSV